MDNADLEKLKISPGRLVPKFASKITEYNVTVGSEVSEIKLTPITSDSGASTTIKGDAAGRNVQLKEGKTTVVEILVTAEDGHSTKAYTVSIHRLSPSDACLSQLDISAGKLQPSFQQSLFTYYCDLPSNVTTVTLRAKAEDPKIQIAMKSGAPVGTVTLSAGLTVIEVLVTSPNGKNTATYTINAMRLQCPYSIELKTPSPSYRCTACTGVLHCPCKVNGQSSEGVYCRQCLVELSRINKVDPLSSKPLGEGWMILDQEVDKRVSEQTASCITQFGKVEGLVGEIPALVAQQKKTEETSESCEDCSKKVPFGLLGLHKQISCSSKVSEAPLKTEVKQMVWEKRLIDDSLSASLDEALGAAKKSEEKYLKMLKEQDSTSFSVADIIELLKRAGSCYAAAIHISPKDPRGHVGLGTVMEELFYVADMYGFKETETSNDDDESDAEISSKEEEFLAICKLHGVPETATLAQQLRAVEAEFTSLKQAGQSHRAEQVQQLYQWKSKKAFQASNSSYAVDIESPLYKAKVKFEHAVSLRSTDHTACYHLGRLSLLLGDFKLAEKCLKTAASLKPSHSETLLCLGKVLVQSNPDQARPLLSHGLSVYLRIREDVAEGTHCAYLQALHAAEFWRPTNTLIGECFLSLACLGGHSFLDQDSCLKCASRLFSITPGLQNGSTLKQLLWILLRARASLLERDLKVKPSQARVICQQVSALITHCQLPPTEELRTMQMKVFENGVILDPTNSTALTRLGAGQLQQYEATGDGVWLTLAEKTFRASIACEGKPEGGKEPPGEIAQQEWWKKRKTTEAKPSSASAPPKTTPATKQTISKTTVPTKPAAGRGKQTTPTVKQPVGGRGRQPVVTKPVAGRGGGGRGGAQVGRGGGKGGAQIGSKGQGVATLGDLKSDVKKPSAADAGKQPQKLKLKTEAQQEDVEHKVEESKTTPPSGAGAPGKLNKVTHHPRLGLARVLSKAEDKKDESVALYQEVIKMAPEIHDAYIELGELLAKSDPVAAVDVYAKFPFTDPPSFDDAYLHGEIVRLLMSSASYDNPQLVTSMIAMGKALGIGVLDKNVSILEAKFKTGLLKKVYAGVHGKEIDNPELQAFFKFKCWT